MGETREDKLLRLIDLQPYETIQVQCICGRMVCFPYGWLQRRYRISSETLVFDLQFRFRCRHCNRLKGFEIAIYDERNNGSLTKRDQRKVIVAGGEW